MVKFGVGQAVSRKEDKRLLTGKGRFLDDIRREGQLHGWVLRSPVAHAEVIVGDLSAAGAAPGVRLVLTGAEIADSLEPLTSVMDLPAMGGPAFPPIRQPHLAQGRVRHVGQPVAFVVADTLDQARDAGELIDVDYRELPVVTDSRAALEPGAPELHAEAPGNLVYDWTLGAEKADEVEAAFAAAAHVVRATCVNQRLIVTAMETRGIIAEYDAGDRWEIWACSQGAHGMRNGIARALKVAPERLRVHAGDIGGGFGMKIMAHPEYALVALAAERLRRPVKWIADRSESFLSDAQARDLQTEMEGAFNEEGRLLAMRLNSWSNMGAYMSSAAPAIHSVFSAGLAGGMYRLPCYTHRVRCAVTNTACTDAYRGAGRPEVIHCTERMMDAAARRIGLDPVEIRRRNLLTKEDAPHVSQAGLIFDAQDPHRLIDAALAAADHDGFETRRAASEACGVIRGRAAIYYMERTGGGPDENARVEILADGRAVIHIGTQSTGQGHETVWPQILTDRLGLDWDAITLAPGDSDALPLGGGTGGSRSLMMASRVIRLAAEDIIRQTLPAAAEELEVAEADLEFSADDAAFRVPGTDLSVKLTAIAAKLGGVAGFGKVADRPNTIPNGCHVAEVEIDPETGLTRLDRYTMTDDFGVIVNPLIAGGQAQGGVAQGAGQALMEQGVYDPETGQPLTASFMDYQMPRAADLPALEPRFVEVPTPSNPYGVKGCGEAGTVAAIPAVTLAARDALIRAGAEPIEAPFTPERVWRALRAAGVAQRA